MKKAIVAAAVLSAFLVGCGSSQAPAPAEVVEVTENDNVMDEGEDMSRTQVYYCTVESIEDGIITLKNDEATYKTPAEGHEGVRVGQQLLLEYREDAIQEESEGTYFVTKGLLSPLLTY